MISGTYSDDGLTPLPEDSEPETEPQTVPGPEKKPVKSRDRKRTTRKKSKAKNPLFRYRPSKTYRAAIERANWDYNVMEDHPANFLNWRERKKVVKSTNQAIGKLSNLAALEIAANPKLWALYKSGRKDERPAKKLSSPGHFTVWMICCLFRIHYRLCNYADVVTSEIEIFRENIADIQSRMNLIPEGRILASEAIREEDKLQRHRSRTKPVENRSEYLATCLYYDDIDEMIVRLEKEFS